VNRDGRTLGLIRYGFRSKRIVACFSTASDWACIKSGASLDIHFSAPPLRRNLPIGAREALIGNCLPYLRRTYAEAAVKAAPSSPQAQFSITQANFGRLVGIQRLPGVAVAPKPELESRVENALAETLSLAEAEHDDRSRVEALVMRSNLGFLQKRTADAESDALEAHRIEPDNVQVLISLSQLRSKASEIDEAIRLLERAHRINPLPDVEFMYGRALLRRGNPEDLNLGVSVLSSMAMPSLPSAMRPIVASLTIQGMVRKNDLAGATSYLDRSSSELDVAVRDSLRGYIAHANGDGTRARDFAVSAQDAVSPVTAPETKEFLARLFMLLDDAAGALPLFQELFDMEYGSFDSGQLLDCAARLHRDDVVIAACAKLQERGMDEWAVVSFEVQFLRKYPRERAVQRLNQFLLGHSGHRMAELLLSMIGVQSQRPELVKGKVADLPPV
jgi:tetratricopeptide (TPR) repeat protein